MKRLPILLGIILTALLPLACQKTFTLGPTSTASNSPTFTPTSSPTSTATVNVCATITPAAVPPPGIYWNVGGAGLANLTYNGSSSPFLFAALYLLVNGNPETTAGVTLLIGGAAYTNLTYSTTINLSGTNYAYYYAYQAFGPASYGVNWTLVSSTSIGSASATLPMSGPINPAADGSQVTWQNTGMLNLLQVSNSSGVTTFSTPSCGNISSPFTLPASAYPAPDTYSLDANCLNLTSSITGGKGLFYTEDIVVESVVK